MDNRIANGLYCMLDGLRSAKIDIGVMDAFYRADRCGGSCFLVRGLMLPRSACVWRALELSDSGVPPNIALSATIAKYPTTSAKRNQKGWATVHFRKSTRPSRSRKRSHIQDSSMCSQSLLMPSHTTQPVPSPPPTGRRSADSALAILACDGLTILPVCHETAFAGMAMDLPIPPRNPPMPKRSRSRGPEFQIDPLPVSPRGRSSRTSSQTFHKRSLSSYP